eukprot:TRINITY_DN1649_c0_g2_i1.p1 TRINITY_DN1649_c0_g2~~TRINITY_DN1649_c0_g2_i1.p1  ORF type:complete len:525 (+),score=127.13 TRINITY_DN1649_c0_g2_i1:331-1905(+)
MDRRPEDTDGRGDEEEDEEEGRRRLLDQLNWFRMIIHHHNNNLESDSSEEDAGADDLIYEDEEEEPIPIIQEDDDDDEVQEAERQRLLQESGEERQTFDLNLPSSHSYLGEVPAVPSKEKEAEPEGEDEWKAGTILTVPIIYLEGVILFPGQTIPLRVFLMGAINRLLAYIRSLLNRSGSLLEQQRMIGVLSNITKKRNVQVGTLAEIVKMNDQSIIGKGRQRFRVLNILPSDEYQFDRLLMARIELLPNNSTPDSLPTAAFDKWPRLAVANYETPSNGSPPSSPTTPPASTPASSPATQSPNSSPITLSHRRKPTSISWWPHWVYAQYDQRLLATRARELLKSTDGSGSLEKLLVLAPTEPTEFSFWLGSNIPMEDALRQELLETNSTVDRLKRELEVLQRFTFLYCKECHGTIASKKDIFCLSKDGVVGTYVNPSGFVHETLTVRKAKGVIAIGRPTTTDSWFPGYGWTIAYCKRCQSHLGWRFDAVDKKLDPVYFYGIRRATILTSLENLINRMTSIGGQQ